MGPRLIVGLGNPGTRYEQSRHNVGFWFIDALARRAHTPLRQEAKFHGEVGKLPQGCWLLKPLTFMNRSGTAVAAMARYYRLAVEEILVAHDDLDLPPGTVRLKRGGGAGGHRGLMDIIAHLGDNAFYRLRLGIGHPGRREDVVSYVLSPPSPEQRASILSAIDKALDAMPLILEGAWEKAMHRLHSKEHGH
ncbi:MAG: aminoacyl-tRNA hydrolase [Gammaproteobacteria bacterium]|nr:MAG: aminoacyl-tRNA hydrolase [Gammaproteobacteria bacterium]